MAARVKTKYEADNGDIHQILLSPEYAAVAGTPPNGNVSSKIKAKVSKTSREYGIRPRRFILARTIGTAPDTFVKYTSLPALTQELFINSNYALGSSVTIDGVQWEVIAQDNEDYN